MVFETFKITVAINQPNFILSEIQTLWGEPEQAVTQKKNGHHFNTLNSTELLTKRGN